MKVVDKINKAQNEGRTYYSFEYFPPKTEMVNRDVVNQKNSCMINNWKFRVSKIYMTVWKECNVLVQSL